MALPLIQFDSPAEPPASYEGQESCDPTPKPGVKAFRTFILNRVGGGKGSITRKCDQGGKSEHKEGRAWDWSVKVSVPEQAQKASEVIDWLLANDNEMFRRAGLMYLIWNREIYSPSQGWRAYTGPSPHTDHVHFSFGWPGALAETSFYRWLEGVEGIEIPRPAPPSLSPWVTFASAAVLGFAGVRYWRRR